MNKKIKVSVVNYSNSLPFVYGLENFTGAKEYELEKDIPSVCALKLISNEVDIGLIPVAAIPQLEEHYIVSEYCIGATEEVASVVLYSQVPLENIKTILLDFHSRTSVQLVQILAQNYWNIAPLWQNAGTNFISQIKETTAAVVIGDRTFSLKNKYTYSYDLASEWKRYTGLPFVFACWVANKKLEKTFLDSFSAALKFGIENKKKVIQLLAAQGIQNLDATTYLTKNISFELDEEKRKGMDLFFNLLAKLNPKVLNK
jgi:chorismate dehydratase